MNRLEIVINSHCDLNCAYCHRHSNISTTDIYLPKDVHDDLLHLKQLGHNFTSIRLTGGEPFINRYFWVYISDIHELGIKRIEVTTNGKYLSKCSDTVLKKLRSENILVTISLYPEESGIDYDSLLDRLHSYHIRVHTSTVTYGKHYGDDKRRYLMLKMRLSETPRDLTPEICFQRIHNCAMMQHGYFYKCGVMCNLRHVDAKFGTKLNDLLVEDKDYIDVRKLTAFSPEIDAYTKSISTGDILPFCRHCSAGYDHGTYGEFATWSKSKGERIEFIEV
jgi:hypothetical protein